jgi:hypothetical protein
LVRFHTRHLHKFHLKPLNTASGNILARTIILGLASTVGTIIIGIIALIIIIAIIVFLIKLLAPIFVGLIVLAIIIGVGYWIYVKLKAR